MLVKMKASAPGDVREYEFKSIDRVEFANLNAFLTSRKLPVEQPPVSRPKKTAISSLSQTLTIVTVTV